MVKKSNKLRLKIPDIEAINITSNKKIFKSKLILKTLIIYYKIIINSQS